MAHTPQREPGETPAERLDWVTDFTAPVVAPSARREPRPPNPRRTVTVVGAGLLLLVVSTVLAAFLRPFEADSGAVTSGGVPVIPSPPSPSPSPSVIAEAPPLLAILPASCDGLYGRQMEAEFARRSMEVNHVWTGIRAATAGSADPELVSLLRGKPSLDCFWLDEGGGAEAAVLTVAAEPGPEVVEVVKARLSALGYSHENERGGVRFFTETRENGESRGESHFVRDGIWLATNWYGFGPWGYTSHMAKNVFP